MEIAYKDLLIESAASLTAEQQSEDCVNITCVWEMQEAPELNIAWRQPMQDIHFLWHPRCHLDRHIPPDWAGGSSCRISSGAPVMCLYNQQGQNRLTFALSDALSESIIRCGVSEETGELICRVSISLAGHNGRYAVTLRRDRSGCRYEEALQAVSRWWETFYPPMPAPDAARLPMYSTWYSYHQHTVAEALEAECAQAAKDGFTCVIVDDGWQTLDTQRGYAYCGDWEPLKIPDMRAHVERVHQLGMKYMLWYSVPFMGKYAKAFDRFRDKQLSWEEGMGAAVLDPRFPEVREYLTGIYEKAMREWNLDGFKLDFIDSFRATRLAPPYRAGMDCATVEEAVVRLMTGIMEALRRIKPDVMIEFRQSYVGPAMRLYGNMFRVGDCPDDVLSNRAGMVDLRLMLGSSAVHSDMLMWHPEESVENAAVQIQNVLFTVPQISVRLSELPETHRKMLGFWMDFIRTHRDLLAAPVRAESPQMLYPVVKSRLGDEAVIALYQPGHAVALEDAAVLYLVNAAETNGVIAEASVSCTAFIFDCMGQPVCEQIVQSGLHRLPIPLGGYAKLVKA